MTKRENANASTKSALVHENEGLQKAPQSANGCRIDARQRKDEDPHAVDMFAVARTAQDTDAAPFKTQGSVRLMAPAKVNLYLEIGPRRSDGYHEATTVMHALALHDVVRMRLVPGSSDGGLAIDLTCRSCEGIAPLAVAPEDNIAGKAVRRLAAALGREENETLLVNVEKRIPAEAGLGGGSSDAAAALLGAASLWGVDAGDPLLRETARSLGADVAFFLHGGCACFGGVGDVFEHDLDPLRSFVVLVKPSGGVSTAAAYRAFDESPVALEPCDRAAVLAARRAQDVPLGNNLTAASESLLPELAEIRQWLTARDEVRGVLLSGSGSATFALVETFSAASRVVVAARMRGWWARATSFSPAGAALMPTR